MIKSFTKKAYFCGKLVEVYTYEKPVWVGFSTKPTHIDKVRIPKERSDFSIARAKKKIRRLTNANFGMDKFLTLTFAENVTEVKQANYEFKLFRQKLRRYLGRDFKYLGVIEFQKPSENTRGRVHYHLMLDIPFIDWQTLSAIWGQGRIQIEAMRDKHKAGMYIAKYMKKGLFDIRLYGQRAFFYSVKLLQKPFEALDKIIEVYTHLVYRGSKLIKEYTYYSDIRGRITYQLFALC